MKASYHIEVVGNSYDDLMRQARSRATDLFGRETSDWGGETYWTLDPLDIRPHIEIHNDAGDGVEIVTYAATTTARKIA